MTTFRILIVENDPYFRQSLTQAIRALTTHDVIDVSTPEAARSIWQAVCIHLVLIDRNLYKEEEDTVAYVKRGEFRSGEELALEIDGRIPVLLMSKFTYQQSNLIDMLRRRPDHAGYVVDALDKNDDLPEILEQIDRALHNTGIDWNLPLVGSYTLSQLAQQMRCVGLAQPQALSGEIEWMLRSSFHTHDQIAIAFPLWQTEDLSAVPVRAARNGHSDQFIVLWGCPARIARARATSLRHDPGGTDAGLPTLRAYSERLHSSAIVYQLHGADLARLRTLGAFYHAHRASGRICAALQALFSDVLRRWYAQPPVYLHGDGVIESYLRALDLSRDQLGPDRLRAMAAAATDQLPVNRQSIEQMPGVLIAHTLDGQSLRYPSLTQGLQLDRLAKDIQVCCGLVLRSLGPDTVLVDDRSDRSWPLDLSRSLDGAPLVLDFALFETAIKAKLLDHADLSQRHELERRLLSAPSLSHELDSSGLDPDMSKALASIACLRGLAYACAGKPTLRSYQLGLLLCALAQLCAAGGQRPDELADRLGMAHIWLSATMLHAQLLGADCQDAAQDAPGLAEELYIDEHDEVYRQGRRVANITPGDRKLLIYLWRCWKREPGRIVSHWELCQQLYGEREPRLPAEYEGEAPGVQERMREQQRQEAIDRNRQAIEASVSRLRRALGQRSDGGLYIVNERSRGYRLDMG